MGLSKSYVSLLSNAGQNLEDNRVAKPESFSRGKKGTDYMCNKCQSALRAVEGVQKELAMKTNHANKRSDATLDSAKRCRHSVEGTAVAILTGKKQHV